MRAVILLTLSCAFVMAPQALLAQAQPAASAHAPTQPIPTREACASQYGGALKENPGNNTLYNAACCYALAGDKDTAFELLGRSIDAGFWAADHMAADPDLIQLRTDPRWTPLQEKIKAAQEAYRKSINTELLEIYQKDQAERANLNGADQKAMAAVRENDQRRRERVRQILAEGGAKAGDDYFHAAMVFQHGEVPDDYKLAKELAEKAFELNPKLGIARWLSAAAHDRWLWMTGKPQQYGTQFKKAQDGSWTMDPIDETAVTDEQRRQLNVPPLAESKKRLELMNQKQPPAPPKSNG